MVPFVEGRVLAAVVVVVGAALASYLFAGIARRVALRHGIMDRPNERSSHSVPTPRGGGIGIVIPVLAAAAFEAAAGSRAAAAVLVGGGAVALVGWFDDVYSLSARVRFTIQVATAIVAVQLVGPPSAGISTAAELTAFAVAVLFIVWITNLYNFMDGIDGLAGTEALIAFGAAAVLLYQRAPEISVIAGAASAASGAFLLWNWSPARIFMGDVGSGFLGFVFAVLALASEVQLALPIEAWIVLLGVFIVDATATLVRRVFHGERWYSAHRTHAYQLAAQTTKHSRVTAVVAVINIALAVIVLYCARSSVDFRIPLIGALAALLLLWLWIVRRYQTSINR